MKPIHDRKTLNNKNIKKIKIRNNREITSKALSNSEIYIWQHSLYVFEKYFVLLVLVLSVVVY